MANSTVDTSSIANVKANSNNDNSNNNNCNSNDNNDNNNVNGNNCSNASHLGVAPSYHAHL